MRWRRKLPVEWARRALAHARPHAGWLGLCLVATAWTLMGSFSLLSYPAPNADDAWVGSEAVSLLETGRLHTPILAGPLQDSEHYSLWRLYSVSLAGFFWFTGVGLSQARAFSVLGALAGAAAMYWLGRRLIGPQVGALAGAFHLLSLRTLYASHHVRPETWVNALSIMALLLFWELRCRRRRWLAFLLGLLVSFNVNVYVTAIYVSLALALAVLFEFRRRADWSIAIAFTVGGMVGLGYWIVTHGGADIGNTLQQWQWRLEVATDVTHYSQWLPTAIAKSLGLLQYGILLHSRLGLLEAALLMAGLAALLARRQPAHLYLLYIGSAMWLGLVTPYKNIYHVVDIEPALSLTLAVGALGLSRLLRRRWPSAVWASPLGVVLPLLLAYSLAQTSITIRSQVVDYERYAQELRQLVPAEARVLGEATYWWALRDRSYVSDYELVDHSTMSPHEPPASLVARLMREQAIDTVLLDEGLGYHSVLLHQPLYNALRDYTALHCQPVGAVSGYGYGVDEGGPAIKRTEVLICHPS